MKQNLFLEFVRDATEIYVECVFMSVRKYFVGG